MASAVSSAGTTSASSTWREAAAGAPGATPTWNCAGRRWRACRRSFAEDWYWATHSLPPLILPPQYDSEGALCQVVASGPADAQETCSLFFVEMINAAHERVWITLAVFLFPDEAVMAALRLRCCAASTCAC